MNNFAAHLLGFRRLVVLLSLITFLVGQAPSIPGEAAFGHPTSPQGRLTHGIHNADNWSGKPGIPHPENQFEPLDALPIEAARMDCLDYRAAGRKNKQSIMAYAYFADTGTNWEVRAGSPCNTSAHIDLTNNPAVDYAPRLSFDAKQVVFVSDRDGNDEIYSIRLDDHLPRRLTSNGAIDTMPAYSPEGTQIAFVSDRSGYPELYAMLSDGTGLKQLTAFEMITVYPDWSAIHQKIAFTLRDGWAGAIIQINPDGSNATMITSGAVPLLGRVRWSPDGTKLAFEYDYNNDGWIDLGTVNADGSGFQLLKASAGSHDLQLGNWSADGTLLFYDHLIYNYSYDEGQWYLSDAMQYVLTISDQYVEPIYVFNGAALDTDVRNPDSQAPTSRVEPLPDWLPAGNNLDIGFGGDDSPSGLYSVKVEYRTNTDTEWNHLTTAGGINAPVYRYQWGYPGPTTPGTMVSLRTNAEDMSGNIELEHLVPDEVVGFYQYKADGLVTDAREHPLERVQLTVSPAAMNAPLSDASGSASVYFSGAGSFQVGYSRPGTGSLPANTWEIDGSRTFETVLPGPDEQVINGQFTAAMPLDGWMEGGTLLAAEGAGRDGGKAAEITPECNSDLCLTEYETVAAGMPGEVVEDGIGGLHIVTSNGGYYSHAEGGGWQFGPLLPTGATYGLTAGPDGTLYVVQPGPPAQVFRKPAGGEWFPVSLPNPGIQNPGIAVDNQGRLHMVYTYAEPDEAPGLFYSCLSTGGTCETPRTLETGGAQLLAPPAIEIAGNGDVHILYELAMQALKVVSILPAGEIRTTLMGPSAWSSDRPQLALGPDGTLHAMVRRITTLWVDNQANYQYVYYYWICPPGGTWSSQVTLWKSMLVPYQLFGGLPWGGIAVDAHNTVHVALVDTPQTNVSIVYLTKSASSNEWNIKKSARYSESLAFSLGLNGQGHLLTNHSSHIFYQAVEFSSQAETGWISQTITLPETLHKPTLSVFYWLEQLVPSDASSFEAVVLEEGKDTVSLAVETGSTGGWAHAWADMDGWLGKHITLQFRLNQAAGEYPAHLRIDEVSLSSWTTPLLTGITPVQVDRIPVEGAWIRIHGGNLMPGSSVFIGTQPISVVEYDTGTGDLRALLPSSISLGTYDLRVVTPNGLEETLPGALQVGNPAVFLPVLLKSPW